MVRRFGNRRTWSVVAAVAAVLLVAAGVFAVLRGPLHSGQPAAGPSAPPGSTTTSPPGTTPPPSSTAPPSTTAPPPPTTAPPTTVPPSTVPPTTVSPTGIPASLLGQDVTVLPTSRRVVALTFDAGANSAGLPSILRTLAAQHVPATFFLTGQWAAANPAGVSAIVAAGHRVGNHSMTHPNFTTLSDAQIRDQVLSAERTIRAAGADPRPLFRFPSGDRDARTIADVNALGYVAVRWTVDTLGWEGTSGGQTVTSVVDRALAALRPGEIVLMHVGSNPDDGTTLDADALPTVIARMRAAGYGFVTLDALLG